MFLHLNAVAFSSLLPPELPLLWSSKLRSTAGFCSLKSPAPSSSTARCVSISLSVKVLDSLAKLHSTMAHEMCHAAAFLLDAAIRPPHGRAFRRWAKRCEDAVEGLRVTTCHRYDIFYPWKYQCEAATCGRVVGRHTDSLDVVTASCAQCGGRLVRLGKFTREGKAVERPLNGFASFVQLNYARAKTPHTPHREVMRMLSTQWKEKGGSAALSTSTSREDEGPRLGIPPVESSDEQ